MNGKRRSKPTVFVVTLFALLAAGLGAVLVLVSSGKSPGAHLLAMCPPSPDGHLGLVVGSTSTWKSTTTTRARFQVIDLRTGARTVDVPMGAWKGAVAPVCPGPARPGEVWLVEPGGAIETRRLADGAQTTSAEDLAKRDPQLSTGIQSVGWDFRQSALTVQTRDAHRFQLSSADLSAHPHDGQVGMFAWDHGYADGVLQTSVVTYYRGGGPGLRLRDGRAITLQGDDRARLVVDGKPMPGDDFLHPNLLRAQGGSVEIQGPPGVLVAEETLVGSRRYRLTRVSLDGTRRWSFDPGVVLPASWRYNPVPWTLVDGDGAVLHVGDGEILAIDVHTGALRWRTHL